MRGDRAVRDSRHNKDLENLKSSLKKGNKSKKHRVVFDESANEFFEADYIIVVRDECGYSDGENEDCSGCEACDRFQEPETGALSPPEGYKDLGLFNRDGTLREQAWWEAGDVVLVGERSGTVFTPQHLQLLRRLQRERMLRSAVCADCDAHAVLQQPHEVEYGYEEEDGSDDVERELRPVVRRTGKHIAAGEERPRINSSQQTTPTDESPTGLLMDRNNSSSVPQTSEEESDSGDVEGRMSLDSSPLRHRRAGILKGGRLWKLTDSDKDNEQQNDDQRSTTTASDEDGSVTPRSVRFLEKPKDSVENVAQTDITGTSDTENSGSKDYTSNSNHRMETPLILTVQPSKTNSAVQQLFSSSRPPPPAIEPQLVTSETLRAWDAGVRPKTEETAFRRVAERNALRCSLLRSEAKKKQQPKTQETTSLAERIRLLTCDVDDDPDEQRSSSMSGDKSYTGSDKSSDKSYNSVDKCSEKTFASASSSSSSSTLSAPMANRQQPDLGDFHQEPLKTRTEPRRQFLSTLAPLTACVGTAAHHDGFYFVSPSDRSSASTTNLDHKEHNDSPAPDVVAGTPGANDGDDGLAAFARAVAPRTERIRQRYGQDSQPVSSDDEHDDYGFQRRPAVRGIAVKQQLGASDQMLQEMQNELKSTSIVSATTTVAATATPPHACQRTTNTYSWPYYSEAHLNSRPQSRASANSNWSTSSEYVSGRQCARTPVHSDTCYTHAHTHAAAAQTYYHQQQHDPYRNCALYANVGCSDSSQEVFSSQTSSEQTSPEQGHRNRRAESPPPIRSHHQLLYVPYNTHYHYQPDYGQWTSASDYTHSMHSYYQQQQQSCGVSTPQPTTVTHSQRSQYTHALQLQTLCPVPMRYRPVPGPQSSGGKTMICYSEKVAPPMYQAAPGSPSRSARSAPEGVPAPISVASATSPMTPSPNPVYYAMNV